MITTVTKWGNSQGVRISREILDIANISNGDPVEIIAEKSSIIIRKHHKKKLFRSYLRILIVHMYRKK